MPLLFLLTLIAFYRREQIDQDAREIRIIKEMHLEEEEDGQNRERKFRWKHLDNSANFNDSTGVAGDTAFDLSQHESDDENEEQWRRLRYEREQLLMKQQNDSQTSVSSHIHFFDDN